MNPDSRRRVQAGRTWRDLPPGPPSSFVPPPPPLPPVAAVVRRPPVWPMVAGGAIIVLLGFVIGTLLPRDADATSTSAAGSLSTLPDQIVPPLPPDSTTPDNPGPGTIPALPSGRIFQLPTLPEGFEVTVDSTQSGPLGVEQLMMLARGVTQIVIDGKIASARPTLPPDGNSITVRGVEGVVESIQGDALAITWIEPGEILMTITVPGSYGLSKAVTLAEGLVFG